MKLFILSRLVVVVLAGHQMMVGNSRQVLHYDLCSLKKGNVRVQFRVIGGPEYRPGNDYRGLCAHVMLGRCVLRREHLRETEEE